MIYDVKILIRNSGFTPQYKPIEQIYKDYHDKWLEILDIPCNDIWESMKKFMSFALCTPQMKKTDINCENELPL